MPLLAYGALSWTFTILGVVAFVAAIATIVAVLGNHELSGAEKAVWIVAVIFFPLFGALVYWTVRRDW
jgi:hypothetical protein